MFDTCYIAKNLQHGKIKTATSTMAFRMQSKSVSYMFHYFFLVETVM